MMLRGPRCKVSANFLILYMIMTKNYQSCFEVDNLEYAEHKLIESVK